MYKKIIVPIDGSDRSFGIMPYVVSIAGRIGARVVLLRVIDDASTLSAIDSELAERAQGYGVDHHVALNEGGVAETIAAAARAEPDTLVATTTKGRGDAAATVLGSVARKVVHSMGTPVMVFHPNGPIPDAASITIEEVVLPLDGSTLAESMRLEAISWARALGASLTLLQVLPETASANRLLSKYDTLDTNYLARQARKISEQFDVTTNYDVRYGKPAAALLESFGDRTGVLGVIATRGHNPLKSLAIGSVTSELVHQARIPLIIQAPAKLR